MAASGEQQVHRVRPGETLTGIAHHYGLDWRQLAHANHILDPRHLHIGTLLHLTGHATRHKASHHAAPPPAAPLPNAPKLPAPAAPGSLRRPGAIHLGDLSMFYETRHRPGQEAAAAAVVSSGRNDPGGVSYGAYQLASSTKGGRQVQAFLRADGARWASRFGSENPAIANGAFGTMWKEVAAEAPMPFFQAQHDYIARTHFNPVVRYVFNVTGVDITQLSITPQNAVWSMAVQHGRAAKLVATAVQQVGPIPATNRIEYERNLVNALYDVREAYVDQIGQSNLKDRYKQERRDALRQLGQ